MQILTHLHNKMAKTVKLTVKKGDFGHKIGEEIELHPTTATALAKHGIVDYSPKDEKKGDKK